MTFGPTVDPTNDIDAELASLLSTMKKDQAPRDLEERLIQSLAATSLIAATAAGIERSLWQKIALALNAHGVAASAITGGLCGVLAVGAYTVIEEPARERATVSTVAGTESTPRPHAPEPMNRAAPTDPSAKPAPAPRPAPIEAPSPAPDKPLTPPGAAPAGALSPSAPVSDSMPLPAPTPALADEGAPHGAAPNAASDALRKELPLVRQIAMLVDANRCIEARAAITRYGAEHTRGQLAFEVAVLAARCQAR